MSNLEPPRIEFPCADYPIKIMGESSDDFRQYVLRTICEHVPDFDPATARFRPSSTGRYESVNVAITATGVEQLSAIFEQLKKHSAVRMVL